MTKNQLHNLINFCVTFSRNFDSKMEDHSSDYILEKWDKYIGVMPVKNDSLPNKEYIISNSYIDYELKKWINRWGKNDEYDGVKEILHFIMIINGGTFITKIKHDYNRLYWTPSKLVDAIKKVIPNVNDINEYPYNNLHGILKIQVNEWLEEERRDFNLCQLL
jgi:hypothetical protein